MKRGVVAVALWVWLAPAALGQIAVPKEVSGDVGTFVRVPAEAKGEVQWFAADSGLQVFPPELLRDSRTAVVVALKAGRYRLLAWTCADGKPTPAAVCVVVIGGAPPDPKPPDPKPPDPKPPGPAKVLRVLLLYETADVNKYTAGQRGVIFGKQMRDYLDAKCAPEPDGLWKAYRIWDKDVNSAADPRNWKPLVDRAHPSMPWIVIADGDAVLHEGPMPADAAAATALINKYAG